jgi:imidazolonepropionase-like amidohydrolase
VDRQNQNMWNRSRRVLLLAIAGTWATASGADQTWALDSTRIYAAPDVEPTSGRVVIVGSKIQAIVPATDPDSMLLKTFPQCNGGIVTAGLQNSHVHFTGAEFHNARDQPAVALEIALTRMLTRYGYTTVFDIASDRDNTLALRKRIAQGDVRGPRILTAGLALFPPNGLPVYVEHLPKALLDKFPQPRSVDAAVAAARENLAAGTDGIKLFVATPQADKSIKRMPIPIASAAADATHRRGKPVFAHPTDIQGIREAIEARVDILAHPPLGAPAPWPTPLLEQMRDADMSMIPTLKLFEFELAKQKVPAAIAEQLVTESVTELGRFAALGGRVLFGTDVGYMTDYDPAREYELMSRAGLTSMQILASLTTTPAERWNEQNTRGRIARGLQADIVVLDADPVDSPRNFAAVRCAIRDGEIIYAKQ